MLSNACHGLEGEEFHSLPSSIRAKKARLGIGSGLGLTITYCVISDRLGNLGDRRWPIIQNSQVCHKDKKYFEV